MSQNVLADAQFTVASVLRPFDGFEARYQGHSTFTPIVFPGTLDDDAGKPGFSPYLLKGLPVPMGAKMALWFPAVVGSVEGSLPVFDYRYLLIWRLRNVGDFQRRRLPYHLSKEAFGAPDSYLAPSSPDRFVLPAATETVVYQQPEPALPSPPIPGIITAQGPSQGNLRTELIDVPTDLSEGLVTAGLPLLPPNAAPNFASTFPMPPTTPPPPNGINPLGAFQQGIIDPAVSNLAPGSLFRPYYTIAKGDELMIACYRNNTLTEFPSSQKWDFGSFDAQFSNLYGTNAFPPPGQKSHKPFPDLGIYVFAGSNPS